MLDDATEVVRPLEVMLVVEQAPIERPEPVVLPPPAPRVRQRAARPPAVQARTVPVEPAPSASTLTPEGPTALDGAPVTEVTPPSKLPTLVGVTPTQVTVAAPPGYPQNVTGGTGPGEAVRSADPRRSPGEGKLSAPRVLQRAHPKYPRQLREEGIEGDVILELLIDKSGRVRGTRVKRGLHPVLDKLSRRALRRTSFSPCQRNGRAVTCRHTYRFSWRLDG